MNQFEREEMIIGHDAVIKLHNKKVIVFGVGGVGGFICEALARSGVGNITLVDNDIVAKSNLNRQIVALHSTIGKPKVEVMRDRILDINPNAKVTIHQTFYLPENRGDILNDTFDYIIDAIDTVSAKIDLVVTANNLNIPIICCMGTGNKLDPTRFEISDIYKTSICPICRVMRRELKKREIKKLKVIYSKEEPIASKVVKETEEEKRTPGSIAFVPSVAGLIIAGEVIRDLIGC